MFCEPDMSKAEEWKVQTAGAGNGPEMIWLVAPSTVWVIDNDGDGDAWAMYHPPKTGIKGNDP